MCGSFFPMRQMIATASLRMPDEANVVRHSQASPVDNRCIVSKGEEKMTILTMLRNAVARHPAARRLAVLAGVGSALIMAVPAAQAVPSYARQTGSECAACHVGGYGPQLTPYGIKFKINGYTDTDGKDGKIPLSAMMVVNATHTAKDAPVADKVDHFSRNDNVAMQEASLFVAGRLADNEMTVGLSLNTNPTLTDPFNTLGQWRFPYTSSDFNVGFGPDSATPMVERLGGGVMGANAYALYDDSIYAELGLYDSLSRKTLSVFNTDDVGKFKGVGTYGRLAYFKDRKRDNFSVGLIGFSADIQPDRSALGVTDKYRDLGIDAQYQYLGNRQHIFTVNASYVKEWQRLDYTLAGTGSTHSNLDQFRLAGSYHYDQTWGGTVGFFDSRAKANTTLNPDSLSGRPNTTGYILQADWTPGGKENSWAEPWPNVRLGLQYTGYTRFMGGSSYTDADGNLRRARDNNTTMLFLWTSI